LPKSLLGIHPGKPAVLAVLSLFPPLLTSERDKEYRRHSNFSFPRLFTCPESPKQTIFQKISRIVSQDLTAKTRYDNILVLRALYFLSWRTANIVLSTCSGGNNAVRTIFTAEPESHHAASVIRHAMLRVKTMMSCCGRCEGELRLVPCSECTDAGKRKIHAGTSTHDAPVGRTPTSSNRCMCRPASRCVRNARSYRRQCSLILNDLPDRADRSALSRVIWKTATPSPVRARALLSPSSRITEMRTVMTNRQ
jgi:hypothetical protein